MVGGANLDADAHKTAIQTLVEDSEAIPGSVQVVREKRDGDELVVAVTFRRSSGRLVRGFVGLFTRHGTGWHAGGAWSAGPRDVPAEAIWASSGGWSSGNQTYSPDADPEESRNDGPSRGVAGGWVNEPTARTIRVTAPDGRNEEDTIEAGVAILIWEGAFDAWHSTAELLDEQRDVIRAGPCA